MANVLVINAAGPETRVALVENGSISEFYLERKKDKGIVGNIYKGKVVRVLPGMQAAFVDIGLEKAAFLYVADVAGGPDFSESFELASETPEGDHGEPPGGETPSEDAEDRAPAPVEEEPEDDDSLVLSPSTELGVNAVEGRVDQPPETVPASPSTAEAAPPTFRMSGEESAGPVGEQTALPGIAVAAMLETVETASVDAAPEIAAPAASDSAATTDQPAADAAAPAVPEPEKPTRFRAEQHDIVAKPIEPLARRTRRPGTPEKTRAQSSYRSQKIEDLLKEGQEVIVQVTKDPIGTKGARVTCHISLPGRHLVFMPTVDHVGISRRIENMGERRRLRELVDGLRPPGTGFIVRTVADGVHRDKLVADIKFLLGLWNEMAGKKDRLRAPALLHPDLDLILRSIRDLFSAEVEKLVIDDRVEYERIVQFVGEAVPHLQSAIEWYDGREPIFDAYGIEDEIKRALSRKVWLKSGGYICIDQAEALVAIDINSGRFVGKKNLEETITAINTEAAKEIVYQLRLRNIGGMIIIDFIDMERQQNREKVFRALQEALQKDRAKTNIVKISELGLVEMTRKRVRESIGRLLHEPCVHCDGRGYLKSKTTVAYEIFREIQREGTARREDTLIVTCNAEVLKYIQQDEREAWRNLMNRYNKKLELRSSGSDDQEKFEVQARWSRREDQQSLPMRKHEQRPAVAPVANGEAVAAVAVEADTGEGDEEEDDETSPVEGAPIAVAGAAATPGQPGQPRPPGQGRRRRRRRGRGGGAGQGPRPAGAAPAAAARPPTSGT